MHTESTLHKAFFISILLLDSLVRRRTDFVPEEEDAEEGDARDGRDRRRLPVKLSGRDKRSI